MDKKLMPCGSKHICEDCTHYYFGCSHMERMTEEECDAHLKMMNLVKQKALNSNNKDNG